MFPSAADTPRFQIATVTRLRGCGGMADAVRSGRIGGNPVEVRLLSSASSPAKGPAWALRRSWHHARAPHVSAAPSQRSPSAPSPSRSLRRRGPIRWSCSLLPCRGSAPLSSRGLGRRPLTAETRVRIPVAVSRKRARFSGKSWCCHPYRRSEGDCSRKLARRRVVIRPSVDMPRSILRPRGPVSVAVDRGSG